MYGNYYIKTNSALSSYCHKDPKARKNITALSSLALLLGLVVGSYCSKDLKASSGSITV